MHKVHDRNTANTKLPLTIQGGEWDGDLHISSYMHGWHRGAMTGAFASGVLLLCLLLVI